MSTFLNKHSRQPKLYIDLPSSGKYYKDGVIEDNQFVHIPVFAMTTADEIATKTPDSLFSGHAVADVIKSCVPLVNTPWSLIKTDLEYILTAIKIASIGDKTTISTICPKCSTESHVELELQNILNFYDSIEHHYDFEIDNFKITLAPVNYKNLTELGLASYSVQRQLYQITNSDLSEDEKMSKLAELNNMLTMENLKTLIRYIKSIEEINSSEEESDNDKILEFVKNNDGKILKSYSAHIKKYTESINYPEQNIQCENEECEHIFSVKYNSDYSAFFDRTS